MRCGRWSRPWWMARPASSSVDGCWPGWTIPRCAASWTGITACARWHGRKHSCCARRRSARTFLPRWNRSRHCAPHRPPPGSRWRMRAGGAAVAASVCFLAVIGMRALAPSGDAQATLASSGVTLGSLGQPVSRPLPFAGSTTPLGLARAVSDDFGWRADGWRQQPAGRATAAPVHGRSCAQRGAQYQPGDDALGPCCQLPKSLKQ